MEPIELLKQRELLLEQIAGITCMQRGKITITSPIRTRKDGSTYTAGPYYKVQRWENGSNKTSYLTDEQYVELKPDIDNYHSFRDLCDRLAELNETLTLAGHSPQPKKKRRSTSKPKSSASTKSKRSSNSRPRPPAKPAPSTSSDSKPDSNPP